MERHMDNERKAGAGRAVEEAAQNMERRGSDQDTIFEQARDAGHAIAGAGPEMARHIAQETPRTGSGDEDEMEESDTSMDEDDEDEDDDLEDDDVESRPRTKTAASPDTATAAKRRSDPACLQGGAKGWPSHPSLR
jgi:hypothetical protein